MYPKSPFSANIYLHPSDDIIFNFNINKITCEDDLRSFTDIKTNIERISFQLYNLKISYDCCKNNQQSENCTTNETDVRVLMSQLKRVKRELRTKAKEIMKYYTELQEEKEENKNPKDELKEESVYLFRFPKKN